MALRSTCLLVVVATLFYVVPTSAQSFLPNVWTAVGATGIVDEEDRAIHVFNNTGSVAVSASVATATLDVRYPVATLRGNEVQAGECVQLRALLRDTGSDARVIVRLMRVDASTGAQRALGEIDTNATPALAGTAYRAYQTCLNVSDSLDFPIDAALYGYYVHAQLIKSAATGNPGLLLVQICNPDEACQP